MSEIEDDPGPCVCTDCQNAREQATSETEPVSGTTSYTGVIRGADEAVRVELERLQAVARGLGIVIEAYKADIEAALPNLLGAPCPESCAGQSWTGVDQAEGPGKRWKCDTCGRIVGQHVSNPIQAADDRRAL